MTNARKEFPEVTYCQNVYEASQSAAAILVLTEWDEFRAVDWKRIRTLVDRPLIIDGRNMFSHGQVSSYGFQYVGIGGTSRGGPAEHVGARLVAGDFGEEVR
jgi:UDPglucose 6-dehydrogenase